MVVLVHSVTVEQAAALLGVARRTAYLMVHDGRLDAIGRYGRKVSIESVGRQQRDPRPRKNATIKEPETKRCCRCHQVKPGADFGRRCSKSYGSIPSSSCRACVNDSKRIAREVDPQNAKAIQRRWYLKNAPSERARAKAYNRDRRQRAADEIRARDRANYARKAAQKRAVAARWRLSNPERHRTNRRHACHRRRARLSGVTVGPVNFNRIRKRDRMVCHICRRKVSERNLHFDHVIPLAAGGAHIESNLAVSHAKCNQRKSARVLTLF
jgi:excisionase family DNA binding protein